MEYLLPFHPYQIHHAHRDRRDLQIHLFLDVM
jgi:hypothetical protein